MLDFTALTDDQLIALIASAAQEAIARGYATEAAAREVMLSAKERADIASAARDAEAERLRREEAQRIAEEAAAKVRNQATAKIVDAAAEKERTVWARRKGIAQAIASTGYSVAGDSLVVWLSPSKEKRVFLQQTKFNGATYATLYVTGNAKHPPNTVELARGMDGNLKAALPAILRAVARDWNAIKIDLAAALGWEGEAIPLVVSTPETAKVPS
jgi:hypothetical protein